MKIEMKIEEDRNLFTYHILYTTDYCDDFSEQTGGCIITAKSKQQALKEFYKTHHAKYIPIEITVLHPHK